MPRIAAIGSWNETIRPIKIDIGPRGVGDYLVEVVLGEDGADLMGKGDGGVVQDCTRLIFQIQHQ